MWEWVNCHMLGRHREVVTTDRSTIHLRCIYCGHRTSGWQLSDREPKLQPAPVWRRPPAQMAPRHTS